MRDFSNTVEQAAASPLLLLLEVLVGVLFAGGIVADFIVLARIRRTPPSSPELASRFLASPWLPSDMAVILFSFVVLFACMEAGVLWIDLLGFVGNESLETAGMVVQTFLMQGTTLAVLVFLMRKRNIGLADAFGVTRRNLARNAGLGVLFYLAALPVAALLSAVYVIFLEYMGFAVEPQEVIFLVTDSDQPIWAQIYLMVVAITVAPALEEAVFRGVAVPVAARWIGILPGVFLVSLAFAVIHMHASSIVALFVMAAAFSLGYLYSGSIITPMVMHILFNGVNLGLIFAMKAMGLYESAM